MSESESRVNSITVTAQYIWRGILKHSGMLLFLSVTAAFLVIYYGNSEVSWWDALFYAVQMIVLQLSEIKDSKYWQPGFPYPKSLFDVLRFLIPFFASVSIIKSYLALAGGSGSRFLNKLAKDHVVILGGGAQATALAEQHCRQGDTVVMLTLATADVTHDILPRGPRCLIGDATDSEELKDARVGSAKTVYVMAGTDQTNLRILQAIRKIKADAEKFCPYRIKKTVCLTHVYDSLLIALHTQDDTQRSKDNQAGLDVRLIDSWRMSARSLLCGELGPDVFSPVEQTNQSPPHVLLVGYTWFAQRLLEQLLRLGHYAHGKKVKVSLAANDGERIKLDLFNRFPALLRQTCPGVSPIIDFYVIASSERSIPTDYLRKNPVSIAYVCVRETEAGYSICNTLSLQAPEFEFPIVLCPEVAPSNMFSPHPFEDHRLKRIKYFDALRAGLKLQPGENNIGDFDEREAVIVFIYFQNKYFPKLQLPKAEDLAVELEKLRRSKPLTESTEIWKSAMEAWHAVPEWERESNRDVVAHLAIKQRYGGSDLIQGDNNELSRMEHQRWCAERLCFGWRRGPRDNAKRLHPDLVEFDSLDKKTQQKDADILDVCNLILSSRHAKSNSGKGES